MRHNPAAGLDAYFCAVAPPAINPNRRCPWPLEQSILQVASESLSRLAQLSFVLALSL